MVQHMPESFTTMLAHWLDEICEIKVKEALMGTWLRGECCNCPWRVSHTVRKKAGRSRGDSWSGETL